MSVVESHARDQTSRQHVQPRAFTSAPAPSLELLLTIRKCPEVQNCCLLIPKTCKKYQKSQEGHNTAACHPERSASIQNCYLLTRRNVYISPCTELSYNYCLLTWRNIHIHKAILYFYPHCLCQESPIVAKWWITRVHKEHKEQNKNKPLHCLYQEGESSKMIYKQWKFRSNGWHTEQKLWYVDKF